MGTRKASVLFIAVFILLFGENMSQENAQGKLSDSLLECYNTTSGLLEEYRLPHNIQSFIALIRKIEDSPLLNMDLRQLSVALLHRFRQDGIVIQPDVDRGPGITPYTPEGFQFYRHAEMLKLIPGNAQSFPNNSLHRIERCSLHFMLSSTIETIERGDESSTCKIDENSLRMARNLDRYNKLDPNLVDVETLTPDEIKSIKDDNSDSQGNGPFIPDLYYPAVPPNHRGRALIQQAPTSRCPSESGVLKTDWGVISAGPLLGGIAAALQPQNVKIRDIMRQGTLATATMADLTLDNKWIATLAGDLSEVALRQGLGKEPYKIGTEGHFNSSIIPKHYFLNDDQGLEFTAAEIRGDLDGLIMANEMSYWYSRVPGLKLSQIFDMYYSDRGVFNTTIRACNRRKLLGNVAPNETTWTQTYRAATVLKSNSKLPKGTFSDDVVEQFSIRATNKMFEFISTSMNNDKNCQDTAGDSKSEVFNRLAVDLNIFIDTKWPFNTIKQILTLLLEKAEIHKYGSNFTLFNAQNGNVMVNLTNSILDLYIFNETQYTSYTKGYDLPKLLDVLKSQQTKKLNRERELSIGGGRSDVVLILPYTSTDLSQTDKEFSLEQLIKMRQDAPDSTIIFLTGGAKDRWSSLVLNPDEDIFSVGSGTNREIRGPIDDLINRMKRIPRRLINSQCGANYEAAGSSAAYIDYLEPKGINFYRLHPNYFHKNDYGEVYPGIKVQASSVSDELQICHSRNPMHINSTEEGRECTTLNMNSHTFTFDCSSANYINECNPIYLSISTNVSTSADSLNRCRDSNMCRYPDMIKYTISLENLSCASAASSIASFKVILLILFAFLKCIR